MILLDVQAAAEAAAGGAAVVCKSAAATAAGRIAASFQPQARRALGLLVLPLWFQRVLM